MDRPPTAATFNDVHLFVRIHTVGMYTPSSSVSQSASSSFVQQQQLVARHSLVSRRPSSSSAPAVHSSQAPVPVPARSISSSVVVHRCCSSVRRHFSHCHCLLPLLLRRPRRPTSSNLTSCQWMFSGNYSGMAGNAIGESNITMSGFLIYDTNSAKVNVSTSNGFRTGYRLSAFNGTRGLYYAGLLGIGAGSNTVATYLAPPGSDTTTTNDNVLFTDAQPYLSDYVSGSYVGGVGFDNTAVSATSQGSNLNTAGASSIYHTSGSVYCQDGSTTYCGYVQRCTPVCAHTHRRHVHTIVVCLAVCQQLIRPAAAARRSPLPRQSSSVLFVGTGGAQQPSSSSSSSSLHQQLCRRPPLLFVGPPPLQPLPLSTAACYVVLVALRRPT